MVERRKVVVRVLRVINCTLNVVANMECLGVEKLCPVTLAHIHDNSST